MGKAKEPKSPIFSEAIDSAINGYAVGISFTGIGVFLLLKPDYFFVPIVSYIVGAVVGAFGVIGTGIELSKTSKIKGLGNLTMGLVVFAIWLVSYIRISAFWANLVFFVFLVFGTYTICLGTIQSIVSISQNIKRVKANTDANEGNGTIISQIVLFLTEMCGLIVAVLNVISAIKE